MVYNLARAFFDLDRTLLRHNSSFAFSRFLYKAGVLNRGDLLYFSLLYFAHLFLGLSLWNLHILSFKKAFKGKSVTELESFLPAFLPTLKWYEPALKRLNQLRGEGYEVYIISSSPYFIVKPIALSIGITHVKATEYKIDNTGCLCDIALLVNGEKKAEFVRRFEGETIAFSDSCQDLPFLEAASCAIAVNPDRRLASIARERRWEIL